MSRLKIWKIAASFVVVCIGLMMLRSINTLDHDAIHILVSRIRREERN